ncbi:MAG: DUF2177 family protein [Tepidamorphaceae bacterium]|nr:DUF2177 family protein [Rhodobiaceae bacterium]MCC0049311.1 DUF2177 family protein [Rhodobiaceae bacterium]
MKQFVVAYLAAAGTFLAIDYVWLAHLARNFFVSRLGHLLLEKPIYAAAGGFYLLYAVGIVIFAVSPALRMGSPGMAFLYGALFGFFCYGTYDITNFATLKGWPVQVMLVDVAWGTTLTGLSALAAFYAARHF